VRPYQTGSEDDATMPATDENPHATGQPGDPNPNAIPE
jgi:hypothetical protein